MLAGNVLSTIPGILTAVFAGSGPLPFLVIPIIFLIGKSVGQRLYPLPPGSKKPPFAGASFACGFTGAFVLSYFMFALAGNALDHGSYASYWMFKILFTVLAVAVGMMLSTVLEKFAIARLTRKQYGPLSFFTSVLRANYITLGCVLLFAAVQTLPKRLSSPHFLTSWLHTVAASLGLA